MSVSFVFDSNLGSVPVVDVVVTLTVNTVEERELN